ncbi:hypothetical protein HK105_208078 [Polyrhizophydium stewartii]|uniref:C3H1-type domain-containing protein n=1 Tax=Polyrhizophydium stewartii TaxID=2732419 RepID=A0ABR4MYY0_9FUNG
MDGGGTLDGLLGGLSHSEQLALLRATVLSLGGRPRDPAEAHSFGTAKLDHAAATPVRMRPLAAAGSRGSANANGGNNSSVARPPPATAAATQAGGPTSAAATHANSTAVRLAVLHEQRASMVASRELLAQQADETRARRLAMDVESDISLGKVQLIERLLRNAQDELRLASHSLECINEEIGLLPEAARIIASQIDDIDTQIQELDPMGGIRRSSGGASDGGTGAATFDSGDMGREYHSRRDAATTQAFDGDDRSIQSIVSRPASRNGIRSNGRELGDTDRFQKSASPTVVDRDSADAGGAYTYNRPVRVSPKRSPRTPSPRSRNASGSAHSGTDPRSLHPDRRFSRITPGGHRLDMQRSDSRDAKWPRHEDYGRSRGTPSSAPLSTGLQSASRSSTGSVRRYCVVWNSMKGCSNPKCHFLHICIGCDSRSHIYWDCPISRQIRRFRPCTYWNSGPLLKCNLDHCSFDHVCARCTSKDHNVSGCTVRPSDPDL